jgi:hypothetical protein
VYLRIQLIIHYLPNQDLLGRLDERSEQRQLVIQQLVHLFCHISWLLVLVLAILVDQCKHLTQPFQGAIEDLYEHFDCTVLVHFWIFAHELGIKCLHIVKLFENEELDYQILEKERVCKSFNQVTRLKEALILRSE